MVMDQEEKSPSVAPVFIGIAWSAPFVLIMLSHTLVDTYSGIVPASLGVIRKAWQMTDLQTAWLLGVGSLASGLAQPIFAWVSDRANTRLFGGLGLAIAAVTISCLGAAQHQVSLFAFYVFGMVGVGMFHPIGASTIGQLNPLHRSRAMSAFFVAGMAGHVSGALVGPRLLTTANGFHWLPLFLFPGVLVASLLYRNIASIEHRGRSKRVSRGSATDRSAWSAIGLLYVSSALRFAVNMALIYLFVQWMETLIAREFPAYADDRVTDIAAPLAGNLNAAMIVGMALGGLTAGWVIPHGREKWPMVGVPILFAPCIACFPLGARGMAYGLAFGAGIAFASMVPITLALAQRLLPHRSSLASGMMLGGAWALALIGPTAAEWGIRNHGIEATFYGTAAVLAISGLVLLPIDNRTIRRSAVG